MGSLSIWHWLVVAIVIMLLFGKGRISDMMGDLAKGIKSFKQGLAEDDVPPGTTAGGEQARLTDTPVAGERVAKPAEPVQAAPVPAQTPTEPRSQ